MLPILKRLPERFQLTDHPNQGSRNRVAQSPRAQYSLLFSHKNKHWTISRASWIKSTLSEPTYFITLASGVAQIIQWLAYGFDKRGTMVRFSKGEIHFCFPHSAQTDSYPTGTGFLAPGVTPPGHIADHSPPSSSEANSEEPATWLSTETLPYFYYYPSI
jgi:hypothetical protein